MPDTGVAVQPPIAPGAAAYQKLLDGGFHADEADAWREQQTNRLKDGGFTPKEISDYWGNAPAPQHDIDALHNANPAIHKAENPYDALVAGLQMSDAGLAIHGKPTTVLPEHAGLWNQLAAALGQTVADAPVMAAGAVMGAPVGAAAGGAVPGAGETGTSEAAGAIMGSGAGANALPQAIREVLLDRYNKGTNRGWGEFLADVAGATWRIAKAGTVGAVTVGVGGKVAGPLVAAGTKPWLAKGADLATQATVATAVGGALDGRVPNADDFVVGAVTMLGLHVVTSRGGKVTLPEEGRRVQNNLQEIYRQTGIPPWQAIKMARDNPGLKQEILAQDVNGKPVLTGFKQAAPDEPERPGKALPKPEQPGETAEPPVPAGMTRLYRGETNNPSGVEKPVPDWIKEHPNFQGTQAASGRWFSANRADAEYYVNHFGNKDGRISYVDVPSEDTQKYLSANQPDAKKFSAAGRENSEYFVPPEIAGVRKPLGVTATKDPVEDLLPKVRGLENSGDDAVSPAHAVGRYQIMPGTARQYGFDPAKLTDPAYNEMVARHVLADLNRRFRGDEAAILTAYNAGPARAAQLLKAGPGTALEATHGPHGWVYTRVAAQRSEAGLPMETQEYLARSRKGPPEPPAGGGQGGGAEPPGGPKALEGPEGEDPFKLDTDMRVQRFLDRVGEPPSGHRSMLTGLEMELDAARGLDNELKLRGLLDPSKDISIEDMARSTYASENRADHFFFRGPIDPITFEAKEGTSLKDVADAIKAVGGNKDEFNTYRVAKRTIEKAQQGIDTGIFKGGLAEAQANVQDPNLQKYAKIDKMMQDFKHGVLEYVRDSGGISQRQLDAMEAANTSHVSLRRIMGDDSSFAPKGTRRGFRAVNPIARMEGSDRQIIDPWSADIDNARLMIKFADRNRAAGAVVGAQEGIPASPDVRKLPPAEAKATLAMPGSNTFKPYGLDDKEAEAFQPFVQPATGGKGSTRFTFWRDGKPEVYEAKDPNLARLYRGADSPAEATMISRIMQLPAKLERSGIVLDPTFPVRVTEKHQVAAFMADPLHPPPFITTLRGVLDVWGKSDAYWDFVRKGGLSGSIVDMDKNMLKSDAQKLLDDTGVNNKLWNFVQHPIEAAQLWTDRLSQSSRMGYYKMATKQGVEPFKAAMMARKAYLDYDEKFVSEGLRQWAQAVPFFKADVLGLKQFGAAAFSTNRALNFLGYVTKGVVAPTILLYLANRRADEGLPAGKRYTDLPQWERDNYWITPPLDGVRIRIGKPYVSGPLFGVPLERFLQQTLEDDPHAWDGAVRQVMQPLPFSLPPTVNPILEDRANFNFFTGRPLVPDSLKDASGYLQYTQATTKPAIALAQWLGPRGVNLADVSPIVLDNYAREWTGTLGMSILKAVGGTYGGDKKPWELADMPFVGSFFVRDPGAGAKPIEDFYSDWSKFREAHANTYLALQRNDPTAMAEDAAKGQLYTRLGVLPETLKTMRSALQGIQDNDQMTVDEKRQASDRIISDMIGISEAGSKMLRGVK